MNLREMKHDLDKLARTRSYKWPRTYPVRACSYVASPAVRPALPLRVAADLKEKRARRPDKPSGATQFS